MQNKQLDHFSTFPNLASYADNLNAARLTTQVPFGALESSREFGDYQFYMSFGGDQYLNRPASVDGIIGVSGIYRQISHLLSQPAFEAAGYTAMGKNRKFRHIYFVLTGCYSVHYTLPCCYHL